MDNTRRDSWIAPSSDIHIISEKDKLVLNKKLDAYAEAGKIIRRMLKPSEAILEKGGQ